MMTTTATSESNDCKDNMSLPQYSYMSPFSTAASTTTQPPDSFYPSHHEFIHELTYPPTPPCSQQQQQQQQQQPSQQQMQPNIQGEDEEAWLPKGWKTVGNSRRRSLLEVETNIRTLGELYRALSDIRNQLPSPVATAMEEAHAAATNRPAMLARGSSNNTATPTTPGGGYDPWNHINGDTTPASLLNSPGTFNQFAQQLSQYPASVFDALVRLHLNCTSYRRTNKDRFLEQYRQGESTARIITTRRRVDF